MTQQSTVLSNLIHDGKEVARLASVQSYRVLDTFPETDFDQLIELACRLFGVAISTISIMDAHRQWFKARKGLDFCQTSRDDSFCRYPVESHQTFVVEDALSDSRFTSNPFVLGSPWIRFYAGVPLINREGHAIGTFCIMDPVPKVLSELENDLLGMLANQALKLLEFRREIIKGHELSEQTRRYYELNYQAQEIWKRALDAVGDGVWDCDLTSGHYFCGPNWLNMLGYKSEDLVPHVTEIVNLIHEDDKRKVEIHFDDYITGKKPEYKVEFRIRCKSGDFKWVLSRGMVIERGHDDRPTRMIGTHTDVTHSKTLEETIWKQAHFDLLTDTPNRRLFLDRLQQQIHTSQRSTERFALLFIDLDGFKAINDQFGHAVGDQLLVKFAKRMKGLVRKSDTFARFAGDEFAVILTGAPTDEAVFNFATKLVEESQVSFELGTVDASISASIGVAIYPEHGLSTDELLSCADSAMYSAKGQGKNRWGVFS